MISSVKWIWRSAFRASWHLNWPKWNLKADKIVKYLFYFLFKVFSLIESWCVISFVEQNANSPLWGAACARDPEPPEREREFSVLTYHQKRALLSSTSHFPWPEQRQEGSWRNCSGSFPGREIHAMITRGAFVVSIPPWAPPFQPGRTFLFLNSITSSFPT